MLFAAHQPHYFPWLRYLHKIAAADVFVLMDDTQYSKNGWQNRTRIKGPGGPVLLTVPVRAHLGDRIMDVTPDGAGWPRRHLAALDSCYGDAVAPWRAALAGALEAHSGGPLSALATATIAILLDAYGIRTPVVRASELKVGGRASERLASIGTALGADAYLTGAYALDAYIDPAPFESAGIALEVQRWDCPTYVQRFPAAGFAPDLSAIDLLVNEPTDAPAILASGGEVRHHHTLAADSRR